VLNAASTRSGLATHTMNTARRGKTPANNANRQPISPSNRDGIDRAVAADGAAI
jgi:hypothetical protein